MTGTPSAAVEEAENLFNQAFTWLRDSYADVRFYVERDIVWTVQTKLNELIEHDGLPFTIFNDYPMLPGSRRALSADIAILKDDKVLLAVEFKYEPSRERDDIPKTKFPVASWGMDGVEKDIDGPSGLLASELPQAASRSSTS